MPDTTHGADVRQQLREELLARTWAMYRIVPNPPLDGMQSHAAAQSAAVAAADCLSALLCGSSPTARRRTAAVIERMLWPTFGPATEWWTTPLGEALWFARAAPPPRTAPLERRADEASGGWGRCGDGVEQDLHHVAL